MKLILALISFLILAQPCYSEKTEKLRFPKTQTTLSLSATSDYSYTDAMNKFAKKQPEGYVIESIQYVRTSKGYTVLVKLRKAP